MKKIGIITLTRDENYGNRLQNYAVQEVFRKLGFDVETIINTTSNGFDDCAPLVSISKKLRLSYILLAIRTRIHKFLMIKNDREGIVLSSIWRIVNNGKIAEAIRKRKAAFTMFNNANIQFSSTIISLTTIGKVDVNVYDYFVCGSDQVWNPYYTQTSLIDFLYFVPKFKRIAYSPSFGVDHIPKSKIKVYSDWIAAIPHLSVREEQGAAIIKNLTGRVATVLVDPTLMLGREEWMAIARRPDIDLKDSYLLTYFLGNRTKAYQDVINEIAAIYSCRVINLGDIRELDSYAVDPSEFIYLLNHSTLVCTDSFHGVVLSIILEKNFLVFQRVEGGHSMNSRLDTLLKKFGMESRIYKATLQHNELMNMNFNSVGQIIAAEQNKAWEFLKNATGV